MEYVLQIWLKSVSGILDTLGKVITLCCRYDAKSCRAVNISLFLRPLSIGWLSIEVNMIGSWVRGTFGHSEFFFVLLQGREATHLGALHLLT